MKIPHDNFKMPKTVTRRMQRRILEQRALQILVIPVKDGTQTTHIVMAMTQTTSFWTLLLLMPPTTAATLQHVVNPGAILISAGIIVVFLNVAQVNNSIM